MKLTIRDLFLVTMIVAVCLAWWLDHRPGDKPGSGVFAISRLTTRS
jgi:hypothetical protein